MTSGNYQCIVMGTSAGGIRALAEIVPFLPVSMRMVAVHHSRPDADDQRLIALLARRSCVPVALARHGDQLLPGRFYLAPSGKHLRLTRDGRFSLTLDPPVNYARPSIDLLFESAAALYGHHTAGLLLTGAGVDGLRGLAAVKAGGGMTIVQDPASAEAPLMPRFALKQVDVDVMIALDRMGPFLSRFTSGSEC
jgi:two-component system chemotaxis response regulator CheB